MKKTILSASFGALMLAGMMGAAFAAPPAPASSTIATPYTEGAVGSEMLPVFNTSHATTVLSSPDPAPATNAADPPGDPPADPAAASGTLNVQGSQAMPSFNASAATTITPSVAGVAPISELDATTGVASLVNRSGGGR